MGARDRKWDKDGLLSDHIDAKIRNRWLIFLTINF